MCRLVVVWVCVTVCSGLRLGKVCWVMWCHSTLQSSDFFYQVVLAAIVLWPCAMTWDGMSSPFCVSGVWVFFLPLLWSLRLVLLSFDCSGWETIQGRDETYLRSFCTLYSHTGSPNRGLNTVWPLKILDVSQKLRTLNCPIYSHSPVTILIFLNLPLDPFLGPLFVPRLGPAQFIQARLPHISHNAWFEQTS